MSIKLTQLESDFLETLRKENNPDDYQCSNNYMYFSIRGVCNCFDMNTKTVRGIVSSLLKKKIIIVEEIENSVQHFGYDFSNK